MSEDNKFYACSTPTSVYGFRNRPCTLPFNNAGFAPPSASEIRAMRSVLGLNQKEMASLIDSDNERGLNKVKSWELEGGNDEIDLSAWKLMVIKSKTKPLDY